MERGLLTRLTENVGLRGEQRMIEPIERWNAAGAFGAE